MWAAVGRPKFDLLAPPLPLVRRPPPRPPESANPSSSPSRGAGEPTGRLGPPGLIGRRPEGATPAISPSSVRSQSRRTRRGRSDVLDTLPSSARPSVRPLARSFVSPSSDVSDTNIFVGACISPAARPPPPHVRPRPARLHLLSYRRARRVVVVFHFHLD